MQARRLIRVEFGEHMNRESIDGMLGTLMACGDMSHGPNGRIFFVEVRRPKSLAHLKETLLGWDHWGFVKWSERPDGPEIT